jgi:hypothetical protein
MDVKQGLLSGIDILPRTVAVGESILQDGTELNAGGNAGVQWGSARPSFAVVTLLHALVS